MSYSAAAAAVPPPSAEDLAVEKWDADKVVQWLETCGPPLSEYKEVFKNNFITGFTNKLLQLYRDLEQICAHA